MPLPGLSNADDTGYVLPSDTAVMLTTTQGFSNDVVHPRKGCDALPLAAHEYSAALLPY